MDLSDKYMIMHDTFSELWAERSDIETFDLENAEPSDLDCTDVGDFCLEIPVTSTIEELGPCVGTIRVLYSEAGELVDNYVWDWEPVED